MRWKRTQMSACVYSMMCPMWNEPFAKGRAVVTKILRGVAIEQLCGRALKKGTFTFFLSSGGIAACCRDGLAAKEKCECPLFQPWSLTGSNLDLLMPFL